MRRSGAWKWGALVLAATMVLALGCAKKQAVKSTEGEGQAGAAAGAPGQGKEAPGAVVTETLKPEAGGGTAGAGETKVASAAEAAGMAATQEKASQFQDIRFDFDKSFIRDDAKPILAKVAEFLKQNRGAKLLVEGHCDERGTAEYNMALGDRRADSARKYLVSLGVSAGSLSTVSFGKEKPLDPGHTEDAWAKNRRAHFVLR